VIECVVETGSPVSVATITHPKAPASTATTNPAFTDAAFVNKPTLKAFSSPPENQNATIEPTAVVAVAHTSASRGRAAPNPTSVATPLQLSFAPLAKASKATRSRTTVDTLHPHNHAASSRHRHFGG
jgi:hypothetical protein